jgi:hypothetical protein
MVVLKVSKIKTRTSCFFRSSRSRRSDLVFWLLTRALAPVMRTVTPMLAATAATPEGSLEQFRPGLSCSKPFETALNGSKRTEEPVEEEEAQGERGDLQHDLGLARHRERRRELLHLREESLDLG